MDGPGRLVWGLVVLGTAVPIDRAARCGAVRARGSEHAPERSATGAGGDRAGGASDGGGD